MPKVRRRQTRYKAVSKYGKNTRRMIFTKHNQEDSRTGLSRGPNDVCRSGDPLIHVHVSPKCNFMRIRSRCPLNCLICHGREPGCLSGDRREKNLDIYQASVNDAELELQKENAKYEKYLGFFRTLALLYYLRRFTFSSFRNPSQVFFSLYYQSLTVEKNPCYSVKWVAFQNRLDSSPFLTWKREKRCIVLSQKQRKSLICLGGSTRFLAMHLVSANQRCEYLRFQILRRLFGQKSIRRLIQAGGLDPNVGSNHQCCTQYYFGE